MHRTLTIAAIVIVLAGLGVFAYFYFFATRASITVSPENTGFPTAGQDTQSTNNNGTLTTPDAPTVITARLVKISEGPVVPGMVVVDIPAINASSSPDVSVSYIERQSGNIFSYLVNSGKITRTSNKTLPGIQSADWLPNASLAFVRYLSGDNLSTINTYALLEDGSGGFFLPQNIMNINVSSTSLLMLASGVNGSVASVSYTDGTHTSEVFSTPLSAIHVSFAGKNQYLTYTKPSATLSGYAFIVDAVGHFSRIAGPLNGLVALPSHSGKFVLVSSSSGGTFQMKIVDATTGDTVPLPIATIADKCVWTTDDSAIYCGIPVNPPTNYSYPDDWYQGVASFSDRIWKIDVAGRYAQLVLDFSKETSNSADIKSIAVDPLNTELVFMNKLDGSLWGYKL
jgi:hypothetical protein